MSSADYDRRVYDQAIAEAERSTAPRPRPRFARDPETPALRLPAGKRLAAVIAVDLLPNGDLVLLHQPDPQGVDGHVVDQAEWLPPVAIFDRAGNLLGAFGGHDHIPSADGVSQWPTSCEGLNCDADGNIWVFGYRTAMFPNGTPGDDAALKFSPSGELLLRIGQRGRVGDNLDTQYLGGPTSCYHDTEAREVFISDGYGNRRVISFNSDSGAFIRMWGAYGRPPQLEPFEEDFGSPVHRVARGPNGLIYVADRTHCRIQEYALIQDGARFLREVIVAPGTNIMSATGSAWDVGFSPDGSFMYVLDGLNHRLWSVDLGSFEVVGSTSVHAEYENELNRPAYHAIAHRMVVEENGDVLIACVNKGLKRLKFLCVS